MTNVIYADSEMQHNSIAIAATISKSYLEAHATCCSRETFTVV
jgi:hypothetical protein